jgi:predicted secreted protein
MAISRTSRLLVLAITSVLLGGMAAAGAGSSSAAAPAKKGTTLIVRDLPAQARLIPGERLKIILPTNVTTGYSWKADGGCCTASGAPVARVSNGVYKAPANTNGMVGVPGQTTWTVTALRPGKTTITIVTSPPGSDNTMNDETVGTLTLIVMPKN